MADIHDRRPLVLLVEDSPSLTATYIEYLRNEPISLLTAETGREALDLIAAREPSLILLDLKLPDIDGFELLKHVQNLDKKIAVIVITAHGSVNVAVEAMRAGASDFLMKPFSADRLNVTVRNVLETLRLRQIVETFQENFARTNYAGFIGASLPMQAVYRMIDAAAPSRATVFITGESGTGKELCAEAIHRRSPRADKPFVALNCAAIPANLMESEIFGHVKGAFTNAISDRDGAATLADSGTLFLDEICELGVDLQGKLLRFIQTGTFTKVGGTALQKVDVRFVCATNRDPIKEVEEGRFREDLYYRLHVIPIHLPALRERDEDVIDLANYFLKSFAAEEGKTFEGFTPEANGALLAYNWPGNVRELQNVVRNIVVMNAGGRVEADMLPRPISTLAQHAVKMRPAEVIGVARRTPNGQIRPLWLVEKEAIQEAIRLCGGNIPKAAIELGISASTIYRKMKDWSQDRGLGS